MTARRHRFKPEHYPSLAELQEGERWPVYQQIIAGYDVQTLRQFYQDLGRSLKTAGLDIPAIVERGPHAYAQDVFLGYLAYFCTLGA